MSVRKRTTVAVVQILAVGLLVAQSVAQPGGERDRSVSTVQPTPSDELALKQGRIASSYARLEALLLRGAQRYERDDPRRAELLKRVLGLSKERLIHLQLETVVKILNQEELRRAVGDQREVRDDLRALLELLQSEDRSQKIEQERERVRDYLKVVGEFIRRLRDIQSRTEGVGDAARLVGEQGKLADRAGDLATQIQENEEGGAAPDKKDQDAQNSDKDQEDGDSKADGQDKDRDDTQGKGPAKDGQKADAKGGGEQKGDGKSGGQGKPGDKSGEQPKTPDKSDGNGQESDQPSSDDQDKAENNSQGQSQGQGQKSQGQGQNQGQQDPSDQPPPQPSYPGRKRIQAAEQRMREAQKKLQEANRDGAVKDQEEARRQLELAKAELEEILRQLREEEIERTLAMLESRFKKMLQMQIKIYDQTKQIYEDAVTGPGGEEPIEAPRLTSEQTIRAAKLSSQERVIVFEADKALALLREEGSSVAFPEATEQIRDSMNQVANHLGKADVGLITQEIEEEIIEALSEMIEALQKAQKDKEKKPRPPGRPPPPGEPEDPRLVEMLAELKMIRAMQMRVNRRTKRYARFLDDQDDPKGQVIRDELVAALKRLSDREARIHRVTRDIVLEKNK